MQKILSNAPNATFKQDVGLFVSVFERTVLEGKTEQVSDPVTEQVTEQVKALLLIIEDNELGTKQLMSGLNLKHRPTFLENYLKPSLEANWIEMTQPESPRSPTQKYRLTSKGKRLLQKI